MAAAKKAAATATTPTAAVKDADGEKKESNVTLKTVRGRKGEMEEKIATAIERFQEQTSLPVTGVTYTPDPKTAGKFEIKVAVDLGM